MVGRRSWIIGLAGSVLLLLGPAIIGIGEINAANATNAAVNCTGRCTSAFAAVNATIEFAVLFGLGITVGGAGVGLVLASTVPYVGQPRRIADASAPPSTPSVGVPVSRPALHEEQPGLDNARN